MAYDKGGKGSGGAFMNSVKGMCSYKDNPMKQARQTSSVCGPGMNADQKKANKLLQKAHAQQESLRGKSGM
jgi:hypothetical protein